MIPSFDPISLQKIREVLSSPRKVVLLSHISPDGDAVGSVLALSNILSQLGHSTQIVLPSPFPKSYEILEGTNQIIIGKEDLSLAERTIAEAEVLFCLDFNEPKRLDLLSSSVLASPAYKVLIDHHVDPYDFTNVILSYHTLSSTCLLLYHFMTAMGWRELIDRSTAEALYWGMMMDTGNFSYNSQDPEIYITISYFLTKGLRKDELTAAMQRNFSVGKLQLNAHAILNKMRIFTEYQTALITLSLAEKIRFNYQIGDTEALCNMPLEAKEIVFSIFVYEVTPEFCKVSFRSKGDFPVNQFASTFFNGGGHVNAAGAEFHGTLINAYYRVCEALEKMHP